MSKGNAKYHDKYLFLDQKVRTQQQQYKNNQI